MKIFDKNAIRLSRPKIKREKVLMFQQIATSCHFYIAQKNTITKKLIKLLQKPINICHLNIADIFQVDVSKNAKSTGILTRLPGTASKI